MSVRPIGTIDGGAHFNEVVFTDAVLPPEALLGVEGGHGGVALGRVLGSLLRHPLQLPGLIRMARTSGKAFRELLRCCGLCGVGLAGLDL